jgi:prophage regulatory protein
MHNIDHLNCRKFDIPETGYLRLPEVLKLIPIGKSSWWAGIRAGRFPEGVKLGPRTTAWRVEQILDLIDKLDANAGT